MPVYARIDPLLWESDFFQLHSGKLSFDTAAPALTAAEMAPYDLLQAKISAQQQDQFDQLTALGFRLVEGEVDLCLSWPLPATPSQILPAFSLAGPEDIPALRQAAAQLFAFSRFRAPWYQPTDSGRFYATWVEKAVLGSFDHLCLLLKDSAGQLQGFVTLRSLDAEQARIGLLGVLPAAQGNGLGATLITVAKQWCQHQGLSRLRVATQISNLAALRLYQRQGAVIDSTAYWLYRGLYDPV